MRRLGDRCGLLSTYLATFTIAGGACGASTAPSVTADGGATVSDGGTSTCITCTTHVSVSPPATINTFEVTGEAIYYARGTGTNPLRYDLVKQDLAGGQPTTLATANVIRDLRVDGDKVFYFATTVGADAQLRRVTTSGTDDTLLNDGITNGSVLAVDATHVYTGESPPLRSGVTVKRFPKDAPGMIQAETICSDGLPDNEPFSLTPAGGSLFFRTRGWMYIWKCAVPGPGAATRFQVAMPPGIEDMSSSGSDLYFSMPSAANAGQFAIGKLPMTASSASEGVVVVDRRRSVPRKLQSDGTRNYWLEWSSEDRKDALNSAPLSGGVVTTHAQIVDCPCTTIRLTATRIFFLERQSTAWTIRSIAK